LVLGFILRARGVFDRYNHYVEIIEPSEGRACIRCCEEFDDCPVHQGTHLAFFHVSSENKHAMKIPLGALPSLRETTSIAVKSFD
jgi:hypothetical protein